MKFQKRVPLDIFNRRHVVDIQVQMLQPVQSKTPKKPFVISRSRVLLLCKQQSTTEAHHPPISSKLMYIIAGNHAERIIIDLQHRLIKFKIPTANEAEALVKDHLHYIKDKDHLLIKDKDNLDILHIMNII